MQWCQYLYLAWLGLQYAGEVCTDRDVSACSSFAQSCENFKPPFDEQFGQMFPKAYANVCVEPISGEQCLYTDVKYKKCEEAEMSELVFIVQNNEAHL